MKKTNVMRILDREGIAYKSYSYDFNKGIDGKSVAKNIGKQLNEVYKTLVTVGSEGYYVFVLPVDRELDLKKSAPLVGEKKLELINVSNLKKITGYVRGGCSPIGMKKEYETFVSKDALLEDEIILSAGKLGLQIGVNPEDLKKLIDVKFKDITS